MSKNRKVTLSDRETEVLKSCLLADIDMNRQDLKTRILGHDEATSLTDQITKSETILRVLDAAHTAKPPSGNTSAFTERQRNLISECALQWLEYNRQARKGHSPEAKRTKILMKESRALFGVLRAIE